MIILLKLKVPLFNGNLGKMLPKNKSKRNKKIKKQVKIELLLN